MSNDSDNVISPEMQNKIIEIVKRHLIPSGNYMYGFSDLTGLLSSKFDDYKWGISLGRKLDSTIIDRISEGPTMEYYLHYKAINEELSVLSGRISEDLKNNGFENLRLPPSVSTQQLDTIYSATLRTDISHKMVATRAGLGWIGKTDLLITKKFGPRLRLTTILLKDQVIPESKPIDISRCGTCNICVDTCPAKAANGKIWDITVEREEFFDPWKCQQQCAEFGRTRLSADARVCGICVAVCPIGTI